MSDLQTLQTRLQHYLLHAEHDIFAHVEKPPVGYRKERLDIYRNGYLLRLIDCLSADFPKLVAYLGEQRFETMIKKYLAANPSHFFSVNDVGTYLADFLETHYAKRAVLADIARLERMASVCEDAEDQAILTTAALSKVEQDDWPQLRFVSHDSVQFVYLKTNALKICETIGYNFSVLDAATSKQGIVSPPDMGEPATMQKLPRARNYMAPQLCILWRATDYVQYCLPNTFETQLLECLKEGLTFAEVCEQIVTASADQSKETQLSAQIIKTLVDFINKGLFREFF